MRSRIMTTLPRTFVALAVLSLYLPASALAVVVPPIGLLPLNQKPIPEPPTLAQFVKSKLAAIKLGKALFWDMQAGSDGVQACGSCHFSAGADNRMKNCLNPGTNAGDSVFGNSTVAGAPGFPQFGPNYTLQPTDFPLHKRALPTDLQSSAVTQDTNDIVGSQGVRLSQFVNVVSGSPVDSVTPLADPVFNILDPVTNLPKNTRRVEPRHTPTVINAIFNFANFWDGRANFIFNGQNPFGPMDPNAGVWFNDPVAGLVKRPVSIEFASLASQATGPPLSEFEMSARGRTFEMLGRKMLGLPPLGQQLVHPNDSVLGPLSRATILPGGQLNRLNGLNTTYTQMIQDAFVNNLWDSAATVTLPDGIFSQMEANFSLFWGLSIQLYEATLVSDQTPFDSWLAGNTTALTPQQQDGFAFFTGIANCGACHIDTLFTSASVENIGFVNNIVNRVLDLMFATTGGQNIYDEGWNNTAVRATTEDLGRGGTAPFINPLTNANYPLSYSRLAELQAQVPTQMPFQVPILIPNLPANFPVAVDGTLKMPGLRNVELTAPYFHNGSVFTLDDVVDFYVRGGNFPTANLVNLDPLVGGGIPLLVGDTVKHAAIVAFMKSLTDPRVAAESAPFDHPEILVPNGEPEVLIRVPAKDATGAAAPPPSFSINPVVSPTNLTAQTISGTVTAGLTPTITAPAGVVVAPVSVTGTTWSAALSGLAQGANNITVTVVDAANVQSALSANITVDTVPPALTITPPPPTNLAAQTVAGTVEPGITPVVTVAAPVTAGAVTVVGANWSVPLAGLAAGINNISVSATDPAGNTTTATSTVTVDTVPPALTVTQLPPTNQTAQTLTGTVEAGITPVVTVTAPGTAGAVSVVGSTWSAPLSGLTAGVNSVSVSATDPAGNTTTANSTITVIFPDGILSGTPPIAISDALKALRIAVGLVQPTPAELLHGDVAPLSGGVPAPDGHIAVADALAILKKVVGLVTF